MLKINQLHRSILPVGLRLLAMLAPIVTISMSVTLDNANQLGILISLLFFYSQTIRAGVEHEYIESGEVHLFLRECPSTYIFRSIFLLPILIIYLVLIDVEFHPIHILSFLLFSLMSLLSSHFLAANKPIKANIYLLQFPIWVGNIYLLLTLNANNFFIGLCLGSVIGIIVSIKSLLEESRKINTLNNKLIHEYNHQNKLARKYRIIYSILLSMSAWLLPIQISIQLDNEYIILIFRVILIFSLPMILFNSIYLKTFSKLNNNQFKNFILLNKLNLIYLTLISATVFLIYILLPTQDGLPDNEIILIIFIVVMLTTLSNPSNSLLLVNGEVIKLAKLSILISALVFSLYLLLNISFLSIWALFNLLLSLVILSMGLRFVSLIKDSQ